MSRKSANLKPRLLALAATVLGVIAITAAPASARDEFSRGFENEMGRIVAHAAVGAGLGLFHAVSPPVVVHHRAAPVVVRHETTYYGHRPHPYGRKHWRHVRHPHGHGYHHAHRHYRDQPCDYERRVVIERRGRHAHYRD